MRRTVNQVFSVRISSAVNRLIYYIRKLPLVGRAVPESLYAKVSAKRALAVVAWILMILWGLTSKLLYLGFMVYYPAVSIKLDSFANYDNPQLMMFSHIFLIISFITAGVSSCTILEPKREKFVAVKLMRIQPDAYMKATLGYKYLTSFIYYIPALLLFILLLEGTVIQALSLAVTVTLSRVMWEFIHVKLFEVSGMVLVKENLIVWLTIGITYALAYAPLLFPQVPLIGGILLSWITPVILIPLGAYALLRLAKYDDYRAVVDAATKRDDPLLDVQRLIKESELKSVQTKAGENDLTMNLNGQGGNKQGYALLNTLFFKRHRSLILDPVRKRLALIAGLGAAVCVVFAMNADAIGLVITSPGFFVPYLAFTLYFLSVGERACRAFFYNCDLSMMRYSFYRAAAPEHFRLRLLNLAGHNLLIASTFAAILTLLARIVAPWSTPDTVMLWVSALCLSLFFTVHHLALYYLFQPYSTELNVKNPLYHVVNMGVSMLCGASLFFTIPLSTFTVIIAGLTLIYLACTLILVSRFGHRTFRVK